MTVSSTARVGTTARHDFVLVHGEWSPAATRALLAAVGRLRGIVEADDGSGYYVLTVDELGEHPPDHGAVAGWCAERRLDLAPAIGADTPAWLAEGPAVVVDDGRVVGHLVPSRRTRSFTATASGDAATTRQHLSVDHPERVTVGDTFAVDLWLSEEAEGRDALPIVVGPDDRIVVVVSPLAGVEVVGDATFDLTSPPDAAEPLRRSCELRASRPGWTRIRVHAYKNSVAVGSITIVVDVVPESVAALSPSRRARATVEEPPAGAIPDLTIMVLARRDHAGKPILEFLVSARDRAHGLNMKQFGPMTLNKEPSEFLDHVFDEIEALDVSQPGGARTAMAKLEAIGADLFGQLLPPDLRTTLWNLRDEIETIFVNSDETTIPWEVLRLHGPVGDGDDRRIVEGPFMGEGFDIVRWIREIGLPRPTTMNKVALVAPTDSGLAMAPLERELVLGLGDDSRTVSEIPSTYVDLRATLIAGDHDWLHFTGHGRFERAADPNDSVIELQDHDVFKPRDISGAVETLGRANPTVFFNACQVGRSAPSLTGVGGWATRLLEVGAGAFVGTHWSVVDGSAYTFAATFYERMLAGDTYAAAARAARLACRRSDDPTWLAYAVWADPAAVLTA